MEALHPIGLYIGAVARWGGPEAGRNPFHPGLPAIEHVVALRQQEPPGSGRC